MGPVVELNPASKSLGVGAVSGVDPAGLVSAYELKKLGYDVTVTHRAQTCNRRSLSFMLLADSSQLSEVS